jgi:hypothetical protein
MTQSTVNAFNNQLQNFTSVLYERFPNESDLKLAKTGLSALCKINKKKPIEIFIQYTYQYREIVMNKDVTSLLNTDFTQNVANDALDDTIKTISFIRKNWKLLNDEEKENMWKYLQVLMKLVDKYISENLSN